MKVPKSAISFAKRGCFRPSSNFETQVRTTLTKHSSYIFEPHTMSKRLAITISGAVSLGSYEAGVLYEIIAAIGHHNQAVAGEEDKIYIDVLTGASAGGMTAAIAAQKLLYDADALADPHNNPFYNPWVVDISLDGLLNLTPDEKARKTAYSIFSSDLIQNLADKYITRRYESGAVKPSKRHPAAAPSIRLGLALSNLNGVSYSYPMRPGEDAANATFGYTRYQDEMVGVFQSDGTDGRDTLNAWAPWREAAVSCGAFPFAFRVKELHRTEEEYTRHHRDKWAPPAERDFAYTDGGVFQNEPLGLAKNLVDEIDHHQNVDSRFYLYVAPGAKSSDVNEKFSAATATFLPTAQALVRAVLNQAKFQDWIDAEAVNNQISLFNTRAMQLFLAMRVPPAAGAPDLTAILQTAANVLLPGLFSRQPLPELDTREQASSRLSEQFAQEYAELQHHRGQATADAWIDSILVLEVAAELNFKDEMTIYGITATYDELGGGGLFAFEGFFARALREHDYNLGRQKAREFLALHRPLAAKRPVGSPEPIPDIGPIVYDPQDAIPTVPTPPRDPKTGDVLVSGLDEHVRVELLKTVAARTDEVLSELGLPWAVREPITHLLIEPRLKKWLGL